eukprot:scaffold30707_cov129-Isochrysis_galbana.AAC.2
MYNVGAYARPISFIYLPRRPGDARRSEQTARVRTNTCGLIERGKEVDGCVHGRAGGLGLGALPRRVPRREAAVGVDPLRDRGHVVVLAARVRIIVRVFSLPLNIRPHAARRSQLRGAQPALMLNPETGDGRGLDPGGGRHRQRVLGRRHRGAGIAQRLAITERGGHGRGFDQRSLARGNRPASNAARASPAELG